MLGIIIGVAAVIAMVARRRGRAGAGRRADREPGHEPASSCCPARRPRAACAAGLGQRSTTLTEDDARAIAREIAAVQVAAPVVRGTAQVVAGNHNWATGDPGRHAGLLRVARLGDRDGRSSSSRQDVDGAAKVAVLGADRGAQPVRRRRPGRPDRSASARCRSRVIGVLEPQGPEPDGPGPGRHRS